MKSLRRIIIFIVIGIAAVVSAYRTVSDSKVRVDEIYDLSSMEDGATALAWQEDDYTVIGAVDSEGKITSVRRYKTAKSDYMYSVADIAAGEKYIYVLVNTLNALDGELISQELQVLDPSGWYMKLVSYFDLSDDDGYTYRFLSASGDAITLISTDSFEATAKRQNYEYGTVLDDTLTLKNTRVYPLNEEEGIYKAIGCGTNLVYISDSGKVYAADEENVQEIYPARNVTTLMYAGYIAYAESGYIYMGDQESGDILKLNITNGNDSVVMSGTTPFNGSNVYTPNDIIRMDMRNEQNFSAIVRNSQSEEYELLASDAGVVSTIDTFEHTSLYNFLSALLRLVIYCLAFFVLYLIFHLFFGGIRGGHTIMERLLAATVPLMFITMALFGIISFNYYKDAINANFEKQVEDEGNMMAALFGQESFNGIEYPYDYTGDDYSYVLRQMETRDVYMRAVFYENGGLYLVVDENEPCYYPLDILVNNEEIELYTKAALTGNTVTGTVCDSLGERVICITPIGGPTGDVVYLIETGVFEKNISNYTSNYIRNFVIVTAAFLIILLVVLMILFYNILSPIGDMRRQMQAFADGDRGVRIPVENEDELTEIAQVFNKMADDIDVQILNLEKLKDTYYKFLPPSIVGMLSRNDLFELKLGSNVKGEYAVMNVRITPPEGLSVSEMEELMNRFFGIINRYTGQDDVITIVDDANLQSVMMIFNKSQESAFVTALTILATIDSENQSHSSREQLNVRFVIDKTFVYFGICGDEERYIPVVMAPLFEELLENRTLIGLLGSRLLVTERAKGENDNLSSYENRYIGSVENDGNKIGIYDVYYDRPVEELRLFKQTKVAFEKAIELYEKGYYYEAKNMFAMVLRENSHDMAARYYVFKCESLQNG